MLFNCDAFPQCPRMARGPLHPSVVHVEFIFTISFINFFYWQRCGCPKRIVEIYASAFLLLFWIAIATFSAALVYRTPHRAPPPSRFYCFTHWIWLRRRVIDTGVRLAQCACLRIYSEHSKREKSALVLDKFVIMGDIKKYYKLSKIIWKYVILILKLFNIQCNYIYIIFVDKGVSS